MKSATVRDLKNKAVLPRLRPRARRMTESHKKKMFRIAARIWKMKPEKGKKWISQEHHDRVLYGDLSE